MKKRWLKWLLYAAVLLVFLALGVGLYAYLNIRDIVVWYANRENPRLVLDLRAASLRWNRIELSDIVLKLRDNNQEVVRIDSADISFSWDRLSVHRIGSVTVKRPHIRITDELLQTPPTPSAHATSNQPNVSTWTVDKFKVVDGSAE